MALSRTSAKKPHQTPDHIPHDASEQLYRMLSLSPAVIYACGPGPDYPTTFISHNAADQLGYQPNDFCADAFFWSKHLHPEDAPDVLSQLSRIERVDRVSLEYRVRHQDGHYLWLHDQRSAVRDLSGQLRMVVGCWIEITNRKRTEAMLEGQNRVLACLLEGASLEETLTLLAETIEDQAPGMLCSVLVCDDQTKQLRHGTGPSLPPAYNQAIDGILIGPHEGSCGTAAHRRERVIVEDTQTDPLWKDFRELAKEHGLRACWSQPILCADSTVLGTFAMYYRHPRQPNRSELELIEHAANLAAVAIQRKRAEAATAGQARLRDFAADVKLAFGQKRPLNEILQRCTAAMVQHLDAALARIWKLNRSEGVLELQASSGMHTHTDGPHGRIELGQLKIGLIAQDQKPHLTNAVIGDPRVNDQQWAKREGMVAFAGYPLTFEDQVVGVMAMFARNPLTDSILVGMSTIADVIALGIERKRAEEVLHQSERLASIGTLAAGIAHEVNNPITAILLAAQSALAKNNKGAQSMDDCLKGIIADAERCERIVEGVLQFARKGTPEKWPTDLADIVHRAKQVTRAYADRHKATVEIRAKGHPSQPAVNPVQMEQVIVNLIRNAVESSPPGNRIFITTEGTRSTARIMVRDKGRGMTDKQISLLFDPFYTTRERQGGTGLGLSIAHSFVLAHGGRILVQSKLGEGTTMTVEIPVVPAPKEAN
ncbi:MAG: GAF domain-containing protein [bacterium]|nr:GAF domain-containing protein [bacterium]